MEPAEVVRRIVEGGAEGGKRVWFVCVGCGEGGRAVGG